MFCLATCWRGTAAARGERGERRSDAASTLGSLNLPCQQRETLRGGSSSLLARRGCTNPQLPSPFPCVATNPRWSRSPHPFPSPPPNLVRAGAEFAQHQWKWAPEAYSETWQWVVVLLGSFEGLGSRHLELGSRSSKPSFRKVFRIFFHLDDIGCLEYG